MNKTLPLVSLVLAVALSACAATDPQETKLSSAVEKSINSHPALQTDLLHVHVADHVVYLSGGTDGWPEYYQAEAAARAVPGVVRVVNKLEVKDAPI